MNRNQFDRLRRIVAVLEIGYSNREVFNYEPDFQLEAGFGPGQGIRITSSMKSAVYTTIIDNNSQMIDNCEKELIALVAEITNAPIIGQP